MFNFTRFDTKLKELSKLDRIKAIAEEALIMGKVDFKATSNYLDIAIGYYNEFLKYEKNPNAEIKDAISRCYCGKIQLIYRNPKDRNKKELDNYIKFINQNGATSTVALMEYLLCIKHLALGNNQASVDSGLRAAELVENIELTEEMKFLYSNLGLALQRANRPEDSEKFLLMGLSINNKVDIVVEGKLLLHLGNLYSSQSKVDKALDCYMRAKEFTSESDISGEIIINMNIAIMYNKLQRPTDAKKYFSMNADIEMWKSIDSFGLICLTNSLSALIILNLYERNIEEMERLVKKLKTISNHFKDPQSITLYYQRKANLCQMKGDTPGAEESYLDALEYINKHGNNDQIFQISNEVADFFMSLEKMDVAEDILKENIERFKDDTASFYVKETYQIYLKFLKAQSRFEEALDILEKMNEINTKQQKSKLENKVRALETEMANDKRKLNERDRRISLINRKLRDTTESGFIGVSQKIKSVLSKVEMASQHPDISVLILGESGTGKQIIADMIHKNSKRKAGSLCEVNCSAIPDGMAESEFFGYKKGAFTGAVKDNPGFLKEADTGTLFLDEVGDMPMSLQAKLLKVIEGKNFTPLGSNKPQTTNFRLICATHRNLEDLIKTGDFRLDFFNRINTFIIEIPPLRERPADIGVIAEYYLNKYCQKMGVLTPQITPEAMDMIKSYSYPGNVRELRNIIERTTLFLRNGLNLLDALNSSGLNDQVPFETAESDKSSLLSTNTLNLEKIELLAINKALELAGYKKSKAAALLGITPSAMTRRLQKYKL